MTRWLDDDEQRTWLGLVAVMTRLPAELDAQLRRDSDLTHFEYMVMVMLSAAPDRTLRMRELAERSNASLSRLSHVVGRLEADGQVVRRPSDTDGRTTLATLTEMGFGTLSEAAPGHVQVVRELVFDGLTPAQVKQLGAIGDRLRRTLEPPARSRPAP